MEHVEQAGVHSGDSACVVPPPDLSAAASARDRRIHPTTRRGPWRSRAAEHSVRGPGDEVFVLEANPRASRTVPFISKSSGVPLAKVATRVMMGETLAELRSEGLLGSIGREPPEFCSSERGSPPVEPLRRRGHRPWARNARHRGGYGPRPICRCRLRQGVSCSRPRRTGGGNAVSLTSRR